MSFGLLAFVFAGHAVFPAIYTSMAQPEEYEGMLNKTYAIVGLTCLLIGGAGEFILIIVLAIRMIDVVFCSQGSCSNARCAVSLF